jgi:hypothetical protein
MKNKIIVYVMQGASYSEDGDLTPYAKVFPTLEEAKNALYNDYMECTRHEEGTEDEWIDEDGWMKENRMRWGSSGANQTYCEIVAHEIEIELAN